MSGEDEGEFTRMEELTIVGIGHDDAGAYVEVKSNLMGFPHPTRLHIGDSLALRDERHFGVRVIRSEV